MYQNMELSLFHISHIWTEYGDFIAISSKSPYLVLTLRNMAELSTETAKNHTRLLPKYFGNENGFRKIKKQQCEE